MYIYICLYIYIHIYTCVCVWREGLRDRAPCVWLPGLGLGFRLGLTRGVEKDLGGIDV